MIKCYKSKHSMNNTIFITGLGYRVQGGSGFKEVAQRRYTDREKQILDHDSTYKEIKLTVIIEE